MSGISRAPAGRRSKFRSASVEPFMVSDIVALFDLRFKEARFGGVSCPDVGKIQRQTPDVSNGRVELCDFRW
jgi:hypothetical protein